jgi:hypothetical protein
MEDAIKVALDEVEMIGTTAKSWRRQKERQ